MPQTTNIDILKNLLQDNALNTWTQEDMDEINALPPLNQFTTRDHPHRFLYDSYQSLITYLNSIHQTPPEEPIYRFPNIEIYDENLSTLELL